METTNLTVVFNGDISTYIRVGSYGEIGVVKMCVSKTLERLSSQ